MDLIPTSILFAQFIPKNGGLFSIQSSNILVINSFTFLEALILSKTDFVSFGAYFLAACQLIPLIAVNAATPNPYKRITINIKNPKIIKAQTVCVNVGGGTI